MKGSLTSVLLPSRNLLNEEKVGGGVETNIYLKKKPSKIMLPKLTEKLLSLRLKRRKKNEISGGGHLLFAQIAIVSFVCFFAS